MDMDLIKEMYMNLLFLFLYHFRVMVCLKTDGGVIKVRLSEELVMIVLDSNGGKYNLLNLLMNNMIKGHLT